MIISVKSYLFRFGYRAVIIILLFLACSGPQTEGNLVLKFKTTSYGGSYAQANIGAVWIENSDGDFIKTLQCWGDTQRMHLVHWQAESGGNCIQAVTSATLSTHVSHETSWDCTDFHGDVVRDGMYSVCMEFTEDNAYFRPEKAKVLCIPFNKGKTAVQIACADTVFFKNVNLEYLAFPAW